MSNRWKRTQNCWIFWGGGKEWRNGGKERGRDQERKRRREWRVASPPIAISCFTFLTFVTYVTFITYVTFVTNVTYDSLHSCSKFHSHHSRSKSRSRDSCSKQNVGFCVELYSFFVPLLFTYSAGLRRTFHSCFSTLRHRSSPPSRSAKETVPEPILFDWNLPLPLWIFHFFRCNK